MTRKKQHFVPQFYLSSFADSYKRVWCYDKVLGQTWPAAVSDIAQEKYFYDYSGTRDPANPNTYQMVETGLSDLEGKAAPKLSTLISRAIWCFSRQPIIKRAGKRDVGCYLALQLLRTREARESIRELLTETRGVIREAVKQQFPHLQFAEENYGPTEDYLKYEHIRTMFTGATELAEILADKIWMFYVNYDGNLWTSDHPIVIDAGQPAHEPLEGGLSLPGVRVMIPLSRRVLLRMVDTDTRPPGAVDGAIMELTVEGTKRANELQLGQCYRQVYSRFPDLGIAQDLCKAQPLFQTPTENESSLKDWALLLLKSRRSSDSHNK